MQKFKERVRMVDEGSSVEGETENGEMDGEYSCEH